MKIRLAKYMKSPNEFISYYQTAVSDPMGFPKKIDFDEDIKDTVLFFLILGFASSLLSAVILLSFSAIFASLVFTPVALLVGSGVTFLISSFCKAKIDFTNAVNICIHTFVIFLPLNILSLLFSSLSILVFFAQIIFWGYCIVRVWNADVKRVTIVSVLCTLFIVLPLTCSLMVMPVLNKVTEGFYGKSASDLIKSFEEVEGLQLPCIDKYADSESYAWRKIAMLTFPMFYAIKDEKKESMVQSSVESIDEILEQKNDLSKGQIKCARKYQKALKKLL